MRLRHVEPKLIGEDGLCNILSGMCVAIQFAQGSRVNDSDVPLDQFAKGFFDGGFLPEAASPHYSPLVTPLLKAWTGAVARATVLLVLATFAAPVASVLLAVELGKGEVRRTA